MNRFLPLIALLAFPAVAEESASSVPAPVAPEAATNAVAAPAGAEEADPGRPMVRPGLPPRGREMTPEMRAYVDRLEAIRIARDEQARIVAQSARDIAARKEALAAENKDVKELVDRIAELRETLAAAETSLAELYAADETLVSLEARRAEAETERDARQREMHSAVAAAMEERADRFRSGAPAAQRPGTPRPSVPVSESVPVVE